MKITEILEDIKHKNHKQFSFEIIPPEKGKSIQELFNGIEPLMSYNPVFIDVTTSREEYVYIEKGNLLEKKLTRLRPGTLGICSAIQNKFNIPTVPHVLCGGFTIEETEYLLVDCHYLGIKNIMALRGDAMKHEKYFSPTKGGHHFAVDLVRQISQMNQGKYLVESLEPIKGSDFCIGVAGYPEKHLESPSLQRDIERLKQKVETGADYVVTQMFFDNQRYFEFIKKAREQGITVPIIPGIKPIATKRHLTLLPQVFNIDLPEDLIKAVESCKDNKAVRQVGVEWAIKQCKELLNNEEPLLHFYSMGKSDNIEQIVNHIF